MNESSHKSDSMRKLLFEPIDIASIAVFRIFFGLMMVWEVFRFNRMGWIPGLNKQEFAFKYYGFGWISAPSGEGVHVVFCLIALLALCVVFGFLYRAAAFCLFFAVAYVFLLDIARPLEQLYLLSVFAFIFAAIPAHRAKSIDAMIRPKLSSTTLPFWCLLLLRSQVGMIYFFGGFAKISGDWLQGEPIRRWMNARSEVPIVGALLNSEATVWLVTYGSMLFELSIVPLLLWRKTRYWAVGACCIFHFANLWLWGQRLEIYPYFMFGATFIFLPADWPRKICLFFSPQDAPDSDSAAAEISCSSATQNRVMILLSLYLAIQLFLPLRHFLYPGDVSWTNEGYRFSWRQNMRAKQARIMFVVSDPTSQRKRNVDVRTYFPPSQALSLARDPDMILQFAHYVAEKFRKDGFESTEVRVQSYASLNGRPPQVMIDPEVDLAAQPRNLWPKRWIMPLEHPLKGTEVAEE